MKLFNTKKGILVVICLVMTLLCLSGCDSTTNNTEKSEAEKNEDIYLLAKDYYENKEYSYAYQDFNFIRGYKDVDEILANDIYFKLFENEYEDTKSYNIYNGYSISFRFSGSTLYITYVTLRNGVNTNNGEYGACKIENGKIFLEQEYHSGNYSATNWSITNITDNSITVKLNDTSYTLNKKN